MTGYQWPVGESDEDGDDPGARLRFTGRYRRDDVLASLTEVRGQAVIPPPLAPGAPAPPPPPAAPTTRAEMWVPLGPATVVGGQAAGQPRIAGRVRALHVSPDGQRIYAASGQGGVWYSSDAGSTWQSVGGFAPSSAPSTVRPAHRFVCGSILVVPDTAAPNDASQDLVLVGTGELVPESDASPGSSLGGVGILVATGPTASLGNDPWSIEAPNLAGSGVTKIAVEPGGSTVVAGTSDGLFQRPAGATAGSDWVRVTDAPFDTLDDAVSDVVWTRAIGGGPPLRLWVWVRRGDNAGLWVRDGTSGDFRRVGTAGGKKARSRIAAAEPPTTVYVVNDATPPVLYQVSSTGAALPTAAVVAGVPNFTGTQGFWDLAMAVDPSNANVVVVGGSAFVATNPAGVNFPSDGAIFTATVGTTGGVLTYGTPNAPTMVGVGCHADVHDLHFANGGTELWAACDGGVFRSFNPAQQVGFVAKNDGVSSLETNYIASHPTAEGRVVVGLQDNGILERGSSATWRHTGLGDGGGVVFDPTQPDRYLRQFHGGFWTSSDGSQFDDLLRRGGVSLAGRSTEIGDSAFYSRPDSVSVTDLLRDSQTVIGTTRVWYTQDWGSSFVTLPSATDPITPATYNTGQDDFGQPITVCKFDGPDVVWVLSDDQIAQMVRQPGSDSLLTPGTWSRNDIVKRNVKNKKDNTSSDAPIRDTVVWTDIAPNPLDTPDSTGSRRRGTHGAAYLGAVASSDAASDTLYWFDGTSTWHPTGLRSQVSAPVTAVVTDPTDDSLVYVGTTVGVWVGIRAPGSPPTWSWRQIVNGLPEAAVEDLSLYDHSGLKLLRAAVASRGVWELRLDAAVVDLTYLRAHDDDLRYRARSLNSARAGLVARSWHGSPDVRPRITPAVMAAPLTLPWTRAFTPSSVGLRRFQSALRSQSGDDRVRATGTWDLYFEEVLRDLGAPVAANIVSITQAYWNSVMVAPHRLAEPWGATTLTEADLFDLTPELSEGIVGLTSVEVSAAPHKVDVVVHHRGMASRDGADVRVTLLRWTRTPAQPVPRANDRSTWFSGNVPWADAVNDVLNSSTGTTSISFEPPVGGWRFVGTNAATRRHDLNGQTLDNLATGIATFDLDLSPFRNNTVMLLAAVVRAGNDISLSSASLEDTVMENPEVAVRSMLITR